MINIDNIYIFIRPCFVYVPDWFSTPALPDLHRFATPFVARLVARVGHGWFGGTSCSKDSASQAARAHSTDPDPSAASRRIDSGEKATDLDRLREGMCSHNFT